MTFKRKLVELEKSIQVWTKTATKTNEKQVKFEELLFLLQKAIKAEETVLEIETDEQIKSGYDTQLGTDATIDPKYKDIKDIQQFLYEDNIRDTNPILILSFNKLIDLTIDYLQNLEGILRVVAANCHDKDRISNSIKEAILFLFTGNDANSYELNQHLKTVLGKIMDDIFSGKSSVPLADFCNGLAYEIKNQLIQYFQTTPKKQLKKDFGKKFRKHKKSPYPSISKILREIDLQDIPHNVQGDVRKEKLASNLNTWHNDFQQLLGDFELETSTSFLNKELLQKAFNTFGGALSEDTTPAICKLHLVNNIVSNLGSKPVFRASELLPSIKKELGLLKPKLLALIESGAFKGSDDINHFAGIKPENYFKAIRHALEENRFDEYKKIIKDWVISVDKLMNQLGGNEEKGKYNYNSNLVALNLSKLFRVEHDLIDFSSFMEPITKGLKASGFSLELSEVDDLFSTSIASGSIYKTLIGLYNAAVEKGSLDISLDTLETTLPTVEQIARAILKAKIDLVLNREVQFLTLEWRLRWRDRDNILQNLLAFLQSQTSVGTTIINTLENLISGGGELPLSTITLDIPIKLSLGLDSNNKYFAFATVDKEASENDIYSINNETPYSLDCIDSYNTIISDTSASKNRTAESILNLKLNFENPGVDVGIDISAFVISTGGSAIVERRTQSLAIELNLSSTFNANNVTINLSGLPIFDGTELINNDGELTVQPAYQGGTTSLTFKAFN